MKALDRLDGKKVSEQYPFAPHYVDLSHGVRVHYVDEGPRSARHTIVFLHGNPTWSYLYRRIITTLCGEYSCIAPDYPGFGLSSAREGTTYGPADLSEFVEEFFEHLSLGPVTLMVHDWGGPIGLGFAGRRPELVNRLVISNTWAWPVDTEPTRSKTRFSRMFGGTLGHLMARQFNGIARIFLRVGTKRRLSKPEMKMYLDRFDDGPHRDMTANFPHHIAHARAYLAEVEQGLRAVADRPTLIVWGEGDIVSQTDDRERFERLFPNHVTVVFPEAKHFVQEDAPNGISVAIRRFLSGPDTSLTPTSTSLADGELVAR